MSSKNMLNFMEHPANIHPTPFRIWMTWTRADSLPSYSSFRHFFGFCVARFASPSFSSYFSRLPLLVLSLRPAAVSFLLFLRLFPSKWLFFLTLSLLVRTLVFPRLYFYSITPCLFLRRNLPSILWVLVSSLRQRMNNLSRG